MFFGLYNNLIDGVFLFHIHQLYKRYNYIYIKKALKLCWGYYYYYEPFGKKKIGYYFINNNTGLPLSSTHTHHTYTISCQAKAEK